MIKVLGIRKFKSIKEMKLDCGNITLLIGTNSSGKSTVLQGLLLVAQNTEKSCGLNGELTSLGSFDENRCIYEKKDKITISIEDETNRVELSLLQNIEKEQDLELRKTGEGDKWKALLTQMDYKKRNFQYLSCHRVGPKNVYQKNMSMEDTIDPDGEYAIAFLNGHGTDVLEKRLCRGDTDYTLLGQINW